MLLSFLFVSLTFFNLALIYCNFSFSSTFNSSSSAYFISVSCQGNVPDFPFKSFLRFLSNIYILIPNLAVK